MILKRELAKEKNDEMKYSHFLCTLERANQEKLKLAIIQLKCVPCLNKFTTNFNIINTNSNNSTQQSTMMMSSSPSNSNLNSSNNSSKNIVSHANMSRLLKQMSLIVSTELQQIAIDLFEKMEEDKLVKFIKLKEEFRHSSLQQQQMNQSSQKTQPQTKTQSTPQPIKQATKQINERQLRSLTANFNKQMDITPSNTSRLTIFNPNNLLQFVTADQKVQEITLERTKTNNINTIYSDRM